MANSDYEKITAQIIAALEEGTVPWRKPWNGAGSLPTSLSTGKTYRGANQMILGMTSLMRGYSSPYWGTYRQIGAQGGQVSKGEKSTAVILWRPIEKVNAEGEKEKAFILRTFAIFNAEQATWEEGAMPSLPEQAEHEPIAEAERVSGLYLATGPTFSHGGDRACYSPTADAIRLPEMGTFETAEGYYSTLYHEMVHSTGHKSRLNREGVTEGHYFGSPDYSKEELVAEMGAAFLCAATGLNPDATLANSSAYIAGWLRVLNSDPKMVLQAASKAQRAADLILGTAQEEEQGEAEEQAA